MKNFEEFVPKYTEFQQILKQKLEEINTVGNFNKTTREIIEMLLQYDCNVKTVLQKLKEQTKPQKMVTGSDSFSDLIQSGGMYVDKTPLV